MKKRKEESETVGRLAVLVVPLTAKMELVRPRRMGEISQRAHVRHTPKICPYTITGYTEVGRQVVFYGGGEWEGGGSGAALAEKAMGSGCKTAGGCNRHCFER